MTVWSGRNALWDRCPHLVLNYSSCQRASSPSPWKPLTKSFSPIPMDSPLHPLLGPHFLISLSLIISFLICSSLSLLTPLQVYLLPCFFSSVFLQLPLFSLSILLISPELPLTHFLFLSFHVFPLADILSSATPVLLTKIIMCWLCRMFMFVSLKPAPVASWKTAIILVSCQRLLSVPCVCVSIHPHTCVNACVHMISPECSV